MINLLYHSVNKGSLRTLSFILALALTFAFFLNIHQFSTALRTSHPLWILSLFWGLITLWIHGIGFDIKSVIWKGVFLPYIGYITFVIAVIQHILLTIN